MTLSCDSASFATSRDLLRPGLQRLQDALGQVLLCGLRFAFKAPCAAPVLSPPPRADRRAPLSSSLRIEFRVAGGHEAFEIIFGGHGRLDNDALNDAVNLIQRHEIVRVHHRQGQAVVGKSNGKDAMLLHHRVRQQPDHSGIKLQLGEIEVFDSRLLIGFVQALGKHAAHRQRDFGAAQQNLVKGRSGPAPSRL